MIDWLSQQPELGDPQAREAVLQLLRETRPDMAPFAKLADWLEAMRPRPEALAELAAERKTAAQHIAENLGHYLAHHFPDGPVCALTLSYSSTLLQALAENSTRIRHLVVLESLPGGEGRETARHCERWIPQVDTLPDRGLYAAAGAADIALIGADTVFSDGSVLNKVLSRPLAEAMAAADKPLIVLADTWKNSPRPPPDLSRPPFWNIRLFEPIPAPLLSARIDEHFSVDS